MSFRAERISAESSKSLKFKGGFPALAYGFSGFPGETALRTLMEVIYVYKKISRIYFRLIYSYGITKSTCIPLSI
jgi:hypothetical protein